jgi:hypothetical protein
MTSAVAFGTCETVGPPGSFKGRFTLLLRSVLVEKLIQAQARLKLNAVHLHGNPPELNCHGVYHRVAT